jgi:PAS domain S-box-containing protein
MHEPQLPAADSQAFSLLSLPTNRKQKRFAIAIGAILLVISLLSLPFASVQLPEVPAFQAAIFSTMVFFELITAYVLYSQFQVSRSPGALVLSGAYLFSGIIIVPYLLTFPNIFSATGLFHAGTQSAIWIFSVWHASFPLALCLYLWVDAAYQHVLLSSSKVRRLSVLGFIGTTLLVVAVTFIATRYHDYLPVLVKNGVFTPTFRYGVLTPILIFNIIALSGFLLRTRGRTVATAWLSIALLASLLEMFITIYSSNRFTIGWYVAKWNSFICSNIVLAAMIYEFTKMYVQMTGLFNETKAAERKIREQNLIIERMVESSHEAVVMCDEHGNILLANRRWEQYFELPLRQGLSLPSYCERMMTTVGPLSERIQAYYEQLSPPFRERFTFITDSGETRYFECYVSPIEGMASGTLFAFRDRTEEERMDEIKNEFVSIISHEIRTPLSSIVGFSEILSVRQVSEEKRIKYIDTILRESKRLSNLINDFLDLQRMTSGRQEFHFRAIDAVLLVRDIVEQWHGKDNHHTQLHLPPRKVFVRGDEDRLKQVLHNLISNAIKYSPGQSKIDVYVETDNQTVRIKIQDYGLGIPKEAIEHLFTRFYRVDNSDRRKIGGTGLGLSIVKEIIEAHNGKVIIDTELGKGSIFIVQLEECGLPEPAQATNEQQ